MNPTISAIIPYYNGSAFIEDAVQSVWAQTYPVQELIIVDDGSRPDEAAFLKRYEERATVVRHPENRGQPMARNTGVAHASGAWLAFLDCDDMWMPHKLERQMEYVRQHPGCKAVHTAIRTITLDGRELGIFPKEEAKLEDFLYHDWCPVLPSTLLVEREAFLCCGLFNPTMRHTEDLECFLRLSRTFPIHAVNEPLITRRAHEGGLSRNVAMWLEGQNRVIRFYRKLYPSQTVFRQRLLEMNASIISQLLYKRQFKEFWQSLWQITLHDVSLLRLAPSIVGTLVRNRVQRRARQVEAGR